MVHCHACGTLLQGTERACPVCGMPYASPHLPPRTKLANGRYSVGKVLGQGGFGITYKGADLSLNRPVAIKEFFPDGSSRHTTLLVPPTSFGNQGLREALNNFLDEARTLAQFNHPAIVDVLDVFEENFTAYLVMELLQGETLGARIQERGKLTPEEVTTLAVNMASALSVVHHAGLLHRDIKPDNIFLTTDGRAVLIDFGSARAYAGGQTVSHTRLVTPGYAPLEQYTSQAKFGPYTDIYALSATLYHALTGTPPPPVTDRLAGTDLAPLPSQVPAGLRAAVEQGLAIRIDERPATLANFSRLLQEASPRRAAPAPVPVPQVPEAPSDERFEVVLRDSGFLRFLVLAEIRNMTGLGYAKANRLVEEGGVVKSGMTRREAEKIRRQLEAMGARLDVVSAGTHEDAHPAPPPPPRRPQPRPWQTSSSCSGCGLGCLFLLLFLWLVTTGGFFFSF